MGLRKFRVETIEAQLGSIPDTFICCASYEDRCRTIASHINPASIQRALIGSYIEVADLVQDNKKSLIERFGGKSVSLV